MKFNEVKLPMRDLRIWNAVKGGYSFVIVLEESMGNEFKGWSGYSISWKRISNGKTNIVPELFYNSFDEAIEAVEKLASELTDG